jgi:hypothetical protein
MARNKGIEALQYSFTYTDTTSFTIGWLPPGAYITDIKVLKTASFEDGVLDVGDGTTANKFADDVALNGTGPATVTANAQYGAVQSTSDQTEVKGIVVATGTGLSVGAAKVVVEYAFNE